jgi:hypothetical protein
MFSCGNATCEEANAAECAVQLQLKHVNTPIPPMNRTLLHTTITAGDCELTWQLLQCGANPYLSDSLNMNCIELARCLSQNSTSKLHPSYQRICFMLPKHDTGHAAMPPLPALQRALTAPPANTPLSSLVHTDTPKGDTLPLTAETSEEELPSPPRLARSRTVATHTLRSPSSTLALPAHGYPFMHHLSLAERAASHSRPPPAELVRTPSLGSGAELFTPLSLLRVTSDSDADCSRHLISRPDTCDTGEETSSVSALSALVARVAAMGSEGSLPSLSTALLVDEGGEGGGGGEEEGERERADLLQLLQQAEKHDKAENTGSVGAGVGVLTCSLAPVASAECVSCYEPAAAFCCAQPRCNGALCER